MTWSFDTNAGFTLELRPLRPDVVAALHSVEPSIDDSTTYYPCEVTLHDGTILSRVVLVEAQSFACNWGVWPWGGQCLPPEEIYSLRSSPLRLPPVFANELYAAGESGMGYFTFSVNFKDGNKLYFVTGGLIDFPSWPDGMDLSQICSVQPHDRYPEHRIRRPTPSESSAHFTWCPFPLIEP